MEVLKFNPTLEVEEELDHSMYWVLSTTLSDGLMREIEHHTSARSPGLARARGGAMRTCNIRVNGRSYSDLRPRRSETESVLRS